MYLLRYASLSQSLSFFPSLFLSGAVTKARSPTARDKKPGETLTEVLGPIESLQSNILH